MIITLIAFLFILAFSITIHEFGHFIMAKLFGIPVEKFSIGFGPPLFRTKLGETDFRIAYFPFGGYVKMAGEEEGEIIKSEKTKLGLSDAPLIHRIGSSVKMADEEKKIIKKEKSEKPGPEFGFYDAPLIHRILVVFSGPLFNIASAFFVFILIYGIFGIYINPYMKIEVTKDSYTQKLGLQSNDSIIAVNGTPVHYWEQFWKIVDNDPDHIVELTIKRDNKILKKELSINDDSLGFRALVPAILGDLKLDGPAYKAGMKKHDRVLMIDDKEINSWYQMVEIVRASKKKPLKFIWLHNGDKNDAIITPVAFYDPISKDTIGQIGVIMPLTRRHPGLLETFGIAWERSINIIWLTLKTLYQLFIGRISRKALGGPIAIARLSGESARWGFENLLGLLAIISINLGLINLFPIPALDGGHIVVAIIEGIRRKRFSKKTRLVIQQIGYTIIILLILFVTFNDITR